MVEVQVLARPVIDETSCPGSGGQTSLHEDDLTEKRASITTLKELDRYRDDWDRMVAGMGRFYPSYQEARLELERSSFMVEVAWRGERATGLACFVNRRAAQGFNIGERRLFSMPAHETYLLGSDVLGSLSVQSLVTFLEAGFSQWPCDLLTLGEVEIGSPLHRASELLRPALFRTRRERKDPMRWLIHLPTTFDLYLAGLRPSTRKSLLYTLRRFERELPHQYELVTHPDQVAPFLRDAEFISRRTYQWDVGQRLESNAATKERYLRLAEQGRLICHLLHVDGEPCAFTRGEINGRVYHYETPGFVRQYHRYSPGTVLLMRTIKDLIENRSCDLFDFGEGGDGHCYKARFGTAPVYCKHLQFAPIWRPYSAVLLAANFGLSAAKDTASKIIGSGLARQKLKRAIRHSST